MHNEEIWQVGRIMIFQTGNPSGTGSSFEIQRNEKITRHQDGAQDEGMTQKPSFSSKEI